MYKILDGRLNKKQIKLFGGVKEFAQQKFRIIKFWFIIA
ncbi:hypothetical protein Echvi_2911 [Echinicola vietnamensis DSM 17526]|uniref:Uncharacterized protein n=1 Tax=Echinicola vietnamensis (strain DSM 17526 / LMG 23754 / KMM 6221) TaxID=926556 RepID=L0FZ07_ECHVK|nr:hypothetical protein Echvi_2911 [Echinicola vietnamensis DSM 17526]